MSGVEERLSVRHDHYVRYLLNSIIPFREFAAAVIAILGQFVGYEVPLIRRLGRQDAQLFRYLLNADFLHSITKIYGVDADGLQIYERFEVHFQRDGHYWLQYGLYFDRLGALKPAEAMLQKSISAYPDNPYSQHALARIQLRIASDRTIDEFDANLRIEAAVKMLNDLDSRDPETLDTYPLVTLARHHVGALVSRGREQDALEASRRYLNRLSTLAKLASGDLVDGAIRLLVTRPPRSSGNLITSWSDVEFVNRS